MVDTNIVVYLILPGPQRGRADALWSLDDAWMAPPLWRSEFRNALAGPMRRGEISLNDAETSALRAEARVHTEEVRGEEVLRLVPPCRCTAYDLEFIALAQQFQVPLYTLDRELLREFPEIARPLPEVTPPSPSE